MTLLETTLQKRRDRLSRVLDRTPATYPQQQRYQMYVQNVLNSVNDRGHLTNAYQTHLEKVKELLTKKAGVEAPVVTTPKEQAPKTKTTIVKSSGEEF